MFVPPTPEECQHMTFGMSEAEIQNFAQLEFVEKFFLEPLSKLKEGDGYCSISMVGSQPLFGMCVHLYTYVFVFIGVLTLGAKI